MPELNPKVGTVVDDIVLDMTAKLRVIDPLAMMAEIRREGGPDVIDDITDRIIVMLSIIGNNQYPLRRYCRRRWGCRERDFL